MSSLNDVASFAAARLWCWSTTGWCDWRTARLWNWAACFTAVAAEALFEHPGEQATMWLAAWITAGFRFTAHGCRCATWLGLRTTGLATV